MLICTKVSECTLNLVNTAVPALFTSPPSVQGFMTNADLERDIWQKGFTSLAAAAAGGQLNTAGSRNKAALECKQYSILLTEPLFNFDSVKALTEEVKRNGRPVAAAACEQCMCLQVLEV